MSPIHIDCMIGKRDYLNFCRFRSYYMSHASRNLLLFPLLIAAFAVFNFVLHNIALGWILLVLALLIPLWMTLNLHAYAAKDSRRFDLAHPRVFYSLELDETGIRIHNDREKTKYQWQQVWCMYRTKEYVYLYMTAQQGFILPARCLSDQERASLWSLCQKMLPEGKCQEKSPWYEKKSVEE